MSRETVLVRNEVEMKSGNQASDDLDYWLSKTPGERLAAVTFLVNQILKPSQRMDKSVVFRKNMKQ
jgi:hypothetical protein